MANIKGLVAQSLIAFHEAVFKVSGGRLLGRLGGMPVVELTTTGRRSGEPRRTLLTSPVQLEDGSVVLVASNGGSDSHPAWYLNLRENPEVDLVVRGVRGPAMARTVTQDEKAALWPRITDAYRGYAGYQRSTDRDIPVVICEARD
ncbi:MAG: nitroreductase family deazaflavin-dependent oxidoreductase [Actinobacteria bacterium]|nr:nitroreductase family deazaflavin-dependent oxidoreductase [Actinomycetota bacterium]